MNETPARYWAAGSLFYAGMILLFTALVDYWGIQAHSSRAHVAFITTMGICLLWWGWRANAKNQAGRNSFCFFKMETDSDGRVILPAKFVLSAKQPQGEISFWVSPLRAQGNDDDRAYYSLSDHRGARLRVDKGEYLDSFFLSPGSYMIEFTGEQSAWVQELVIMDAGSSLKQTILIYFRGDIVDKILHREESK